jgi:hypothetical protein
MFPGVVQKASAPWLQLKLPVICEVCSKLTLVNLRITKPLSVEGMEGGPPEVGIHNL